MANNSMLLTPTNSPQTTSEMVCTKRKTELPILNAYWINTGKQLFASKSLLSIYFSKHHVHDDFVFVMLLQVDYPDVLKFVSPILPISLKLFYN